MILRLCMDTAYEPPDLDGLWAGKIVIEAVRLGEPDVSGVAPMLVREIEP